MGRRIWLFVVIALLLGALPAQAAALAQIPPVTLQTLAVSGADLIAQGHKPGAALGQTLQALLYTVLSRQVPNEKSALLALCAKLH